MSYFVQGDDVDDDEMMDEGDKMSGPQEDSESSESEGNEDGEGEEENLEEVSLL